MDEEKYIDLIRELRHLAVTLPPDPSDDEIEHFLELESAADRYERAQDIAMGKTEIQLDVDIRLWFRVARKARQRGMATNDFVTEVLCRAVGIEQERKVYTVSLLETQEGLALPVPMEVFDDMGWKDGDRMAVDCRGEGFVIWKLREQDEDNEE